MFRACCAYEAGPVAFLRHRVKRKLAHHEEVASNLINVEVHRIIVVGENSQLSQLLAKIFHIFLIISVFNAEKHHHTLPYLRFHNAADGNGSARNTLCNYSHNSLFLTRDFGTRDMGLLSRVSQSRVIIICKFTVYFYKNSRFASKIYVILRHYGN